MKAADAERAAKLVGALRGLDKIGRKAVESKGDGILYRCIEIGVYDSEGPDGGMDVCGVEVEVPIGLKLLPHLRQLLRDELAALGVTVE